ncbi:MAG: tetratricopeptide repeat protein [Acidiferrobacterales bacterium]|nr:tetratricopeptide repeat protein [Acidiferrobacterales bacterium]
MATTAQASRLAVPMARRPRKMQWFQLGTLLRPLALRGLGARGRWRSHKSAGEKAFRAGDYVKAEKHFSAALKHIDALGTGNTRAAATLNNLALVYKKQGKYGKAEICFQRALRIYESVMPEHAHVASVLTNLATLYNVQGKRTDAAPLIKRAKAIIDAGVA